MATSTPPAARTFGQRPLLVRGYVIFAWATGFMAAILFFVGIPLQYLAHVNQVDEIVGVVHGVGLYPAYVILSIAVAFRFRLSIPHMALMALAGLLPGLSIYVSVRTVKHIDAKEEARLAKQAAKAAARAGRKRVPANGATSGAAKTNVPAQVQAQVAAASQAQTEIQVEAESPAESTIGS